MAKGYRLAVIGLIGLTVAGNTLSASAESLFRTGVSQSEYYSQPRSLYGSMRAKTIGDIITVLVSQNITAQDDVTLSVNKNSSTTDGFSGVLNSIFNNKLFPKVNNYGGDSTTGNKASLTRKSKFTDTITAQVVQILPNGNLVIQGKKTVINAGEKMDIMLSGIVDPREINKAGQVESNSIANFQIAVTGKGTVSGADSEGVLQKFIKYLY